MILGWLERYGRFDSCHGHSLMSRSKANKGGGKFMSKMRNLCREERRELKVLADDFGLLERKDIQNIIASCVSYDEGQRKILSIYNQVYM